MSNKELIREFYSEVFNAHNAPLAAKYLREDYIQHNPGVPQGAAGFIEAFDAKFKSGAYFHLEIKDLIEEGDKIVVYLKALKPDGSTATRVVDIYRIEDGKLAEHWDVLQPAD